MYNTSKGNYSVKLNKVIEKFNLKNLTPEVDTKKMSIVRPCSLQATLSILITAAFSLSVRWNILI